MPTTIIGRGEAAANAFLRGNLDRDPQGDLARSEAIDFGDANGWTFRDVVVLDTLVTVSRIVIATFEQATVVFCHGTNPAKGQRVVDGWVNAGSANRFGGFNVNSWRDARAITDSYLGQTLRFNTPLYLYGYSAGGMVVEAIARQFADSGRFRIIDIQTYGTPKPALVAHTVSDPRVNRVRWMREMDPVPTLPYQTLFGACTRFLTLWEAGSQPWLFRHGRGGVILRGRGPLIFADQTHGVPAESYGAIQNWLLSETSGGVNEHAMTRYLDDIRNQSAGVTDATFSTGVAMADVTPQPTFNAEGIEQAIRNLPQVQRPPEGVPIPVQVNGNVLTLPTGLRVPLPFAEIIRMPQARIDKRVRAVGVKQGLVYGVQWMGRTVCVTPTISKARVISGRINSFCRILGNADLIYGVVLDQSLSDFLAAASVPGQGVSPALPIT